MQPDKIQFAKLLNRIEQNTEYLSNVFHFTKAPKCLSIQPEAGSICSLSACKVVVQVCYLIFACSVFKTELCVQIDPHYIRSGFNNLYQPVIRFCLFNELDFQETKKYFPKKKKIIRCLVNKSKGQVSQSILFAIQSFIDIVYEKLTQKGFQQSQCYVFLSHLKRHIDKNIWNTLYTDSDFPIIKQLQNTQLFINFSDLLKISRNSLFYRIKIDKVCIEQIIKVKKNISESFVYMDVGNISNLIYRKIDGLLSKLIEQKLMHELKSSTAQLISSQGFFLGYVEKFNYKEKVLDKYITQFYLVERGQSESFNSESFVRRPTHRNNFLFQYCFGNRTMLLRYITNIDAVAQTIDLISKQVHNIMFYDQQITLQTFEVPKNMLSAGMSNKYLCFKCKCYLQEKEQPLTKLFITIQMLLICGKIYLPVLRIVPKLNHYPVIEDSRKRVAHAVKMIIGRAGAFYSHL